MPGLVSLPVGRPCEKSYFSAATTLCVRTLKSECFKKDGEVNPTSKNFHCRFCEKYLARKKAKNNATVNRMLLLIINVISEGLKKPTGTEVGVQCDFSQEPDNYLAAEFNKDVAEDPVAGFEQKISSKKELKRPVEEIISNDHQWQDLSTISQNQRSSDEKTTDFTFEIQFKPKGSQPSSPNELKITQDLENLNYLRQIEAQENERLLEISRLRIGVINLGYMKAR